MKYIDLHTHSTYSDGLCTVQELLRKAQDMKLRVFSVSDHNTVDAYDAIQQNRALFDGTILPAVELSTVFHHEFIELLGYGIDISMMKNSIAQTYLSFYDKQVKEASLDTTALLQKGVALDDEYIRIMTECPQKIFDPSHDTNRPYLLREIKRHPENAKFFKSDQEFNCIDEQRFTREYLFNPQSTLYSDQSVLTPTIQTVIDMIHECGGLVFLAHPFVYSNHFVNYFKEIPKLGIDGIECHYGTFQVEQKRFLECFCEEQRLYKSGGSDFHGLNMRPNNFFGLSMGKNIPYSLIEPWIECVKKI